MHTLTPIKVSKGATWDAVQSKNVRNTPHENIMSILTEYMQCTEQLFLLGGGDFS